MIIKFQLLVNILFKLVSVVIGFIISHWVTGRQKDSCRVFVTILLLLVHRLSLHFVVRTNIVITCCYLIGHFVIVKLVVLLLSDLYRAAKCKMTRYNIHVLINKCILV